MGFVARLSVLLPLCLATGLARAADPPPRDLLFILDGSGSMWGQVEQRPKIAVARDVLGVLIGQLDPAADRVGLLAYGHRRKGDCDDVETLAPVAPLDREALLDKVRSIEPMGKTPITRSVRQAVDLLHGREDPATVVLVSDGLETCGGDPCQAVREARAAGIRLVMHVVGFDVAEAETDQLRCMAEAGGGRYFSARNSAELTEALERAVQVQPPEPGPGAAAGSGRLLLTVTANGELTEAQVEVVDAGSGARLMSRRVYPDSRRNPGEFALPPGRYHVRVEATRIDGRPVRELRDLEITRGEGQERGVDFSAGVFRLTVTANGELAEAQVRITRPGGARPLVNQRLYPDSRRNPARFELPPGTYDVEVEAVQVQGRPLRELRDVAVQAGGTVEQAVDFSAGALELRVTINGELGEAQVRITRPGGARPLVNQRLYPDSRRNPARFELPPGTYDIQVEANTLEGRPLRELQGVTVQTGGGVERQVDFSAGRLQLTVVTAGGALAEAQVRITPAGRSRPVTNQRLYPDSRRNPAVWDLPPGEYDLRVEGVKLPGRPVRELRGLAIRAGEAQERTVELPAQ